MVWILLPGEASKISRFETVLRWTNFWSRQGESKRYFSISNDFCDRVVHQYPGPMKELGFPVFGG